MRFQLTKEEVDAVIGFETHNCIDDNIWKRVIRKLKKQKKKSVN